RTRDATAFSSPYEGFELEIKGFSSCDSLAVQCFQQVGFWLVNRPIPGLKWLGWRGFDILFQLRFRKEMKALPWSQICARSLRRAEPPFARSSFSHFPRYRASWKPIGQNRLKE